MRLKPIGSNMTELTLNDGTCILFGYQTPVGVHKPGEGFWITDQHFSQTTTRHIRKWLDGARPQGTIPQSEIEAIAGVERERYSGRVIPTPGIRTRIRRNPRDGRGKFGNTVEELLYQLDHDQQIGESGALGWYGMVSGLLRPEAAEIAADLDLELDPDDLDEYDWPLNAIIREGNDGDIDVDTFAENREMMRQWRLIEKDYDGYYGEDGP